jgi:hypothetical protein
MQYIGAVKLDKNPDNKSDKRILNHHQISDLLSKLTTIHKLNEPNKLKESNISNENKHKEPYCQCTDFCEKCQDHIKILYTESLNEIIDEYEFTK